MNSKIIITSFLFTACLLSFYGCQINTIKHDDILNKEDLSSSNNKYIADRLKNSENFFVQSKGLIEQIKKSLNKDPLIKEKSFVVSWSLLKSNPYTRLEEHFIDQIKKDIIVQFTEISPENWLELKNNRALSQKPGLVIYIVNINRETTNNKAEVYVSLMQDGKILKQNIGEIKIDYFPGSAAYKMDNELAKKNIIPIGYSKNPYKELENFAFGMPKYLLDQYKKTGIVANNKKIADSEVIVYIDTESETDIPIKVKNIISKSLSSRLIKSGLFKCSFDRKDFRNALKRITHYQKHAAGAKKIVDVSKFRDLLYESASILFLIDICDMGESYKVSTRAFWLSKSEKTDEDIELIETKTDEAISPIETNEAGTYLSVFIDHAYLLKQAIPFNESYKNNNDKKNIISNFKLSYRCLPFNNDKEAFTIKKGDFVFSKDYYKIVFQPDRDCYVYIFQVDSCGKVTQLFPMIQYKDIILNNVNPVEKNKKYVLPGKKHRFQFDHNRGTERMYFIITDYQDTKLESLYESLKNSYSSKNKKKYEEKLKKEFVKTRGLLDIVSDPDEVISWDDEGNIFTTIDQKLNNIGKNNVNILEFYHR